ncbi:MAG: histidine phosphatase family protein [Rhodospirillales bacterium]|nr:histidine phosphatase family protein [Rhodospirillales bacterium]MCB9996391.1 histidine phosphatase family protein [Rhodospirillales bacterium]
MTTLIIARHGNTFEAGETPRRVGARTDLPLTEKGRAQARAIGAWLKDNHLVPDATYSSALQRTKETAEIAVRAAGYPQHVYALDIFNEIDYGPDENKTEDEVIARLGEQALKDWDEQAIVPDGWLTEPGEIIHNWQGFGEQIRIHDDNETVLVVTSNGIARFAPYLTDDFESFRTQHGIKISTGAVCVMRYVEGKWTVESWNIRPAI